jgi:hypothetical protein
VASQFANNAQEAGTAELWAKLNKTAAKKSESDEPPVDS